MQKFPAARIVDGVVKSIIVEKVIHTKFMAYSYMKRWYLGDPPARNDDAVIQAIQKRLPNLYDDPISNCGIVYHSEEGDGGYEL